MRQTRRSIGQEFEGQGNSLNVIRLLLASLVIVSHAWPLGGFRQDPTLGSTTLGTMSVACFFAISGFLITRSREHTTGGRYLWHRFLRILPGYWVCLAVIAFLIAPLAWVKYNGALSGFPVVSSVKYFAANLTLWTPLVPSVEGTQITAPVDLHYWNGSAWSLFYEFLCYLGVAALAWRSMLRTRVVAVVLILGSLLLIAWEIAPDPLNQVLFHSQPAFRLVTTGTIYCGGSLLWLLRDKIPCSPFQRPGQPSCRSAVWLCLPTLNG